MRAAANGRGWLLLALLPVLALACAGRPGWAQVAASPEPGAPDPPLMTLHAYADLVQVPVLVLGLDQRPIKPVPADRFYISLDSGPRFRATYVRREGDDPLELAILIDRTSDADKDLTAHMRAALEQLAPLALTERDHVSVYLLDCMLTQTLRDLPASREGLADALQRAQDTADEREKGRTACKPTAYLWDAIAVLGARLATEPGRRVILAVTDGEDGGSKHSWREVSESLRWRAVGLFGIRPMVSQDGLNLGMLPRFAPVRAEPDSFEALCQFNGGLVLPAERGELGWRTRQVLGLLRDRYIVEFPRPLRGEAGNHAIEITVGKAPLFIRPTGVVFTVRRAGRSDDATELPPDPALHPEVGTRGPIRTQP